MTFLSFSRVLGQSVPVRSSTSGGGFVTALLNLARLGLSGVDIAQTFGLRIELTERFYLSFLGDWIKPGKNLCMQKTDRGLATTASPQSVSILYKNKAA